MSSLSATLLLTAYAQGLFPMAESRTAEEVLWYSPEARGILPLDDFHVPKSLAKIIKKKPYHLTMNQDFHSVITACADAPRDKDNGTWINDAIIEAYCDLHRLGFAQSVEVWHYTEAKEILGQQTYEPSAREVAPHVSASRHDTEAKKMLVGGLYGVSLGRAFFGESMFSAAPNASKIALVTLVDYLKTHGYTLLDTQYVNEHLLQFGVKEIPHDEYMVMLKQSLML